MAETSNTAKRHALDFTNVKDSSGINPKRQEPGDYEAKIASVSESDKDGTPMWMFLFQLTDQATATYPYYCKLQENQLWKVRNLLIACGKQVPAKRVNVDPTGIVGKVVGITLEDDEYEGKIKSVIEAVFPAEELGPKPTRKAAASAAVADDDGDDELRDGDLDELDLDDL